MTESWEMLLQQPDGKYVMQGWFGQDESLGQRFGREFGDRDWNKPGRKRWNPVLGSFAFPCWVDNDGRGYLQPLKQRRSYEGGKALQLRRSGDRLSAGSLQGRRLSPRRSTNRPSSTLVRIDAGRRPVPVHPRPRRPAAELAQAWPPATPAT